MKIFLFSSLADSRYFFLVERMPSLWPKILRLFLLTHRQKACLHRKYSTGNILYSTWTSAGGFYMREEKKLLIFFPNSIPSVYCIGLFCYSDQGAYCSQIVGYQYLYLLSMSCKRLPQFQCCFVTEFEGFICFKIIFILSIDHYSTILNFFLLNVPQSNYLYYCILLLDYQQTQFSVTSESILFLLYDFSHNQKFICTGIYNFKCF